MLIEQRLQLLRQAVDEATICEGSADPIDKGVWNEEYVPDPLPMTYVTECCPFNIRQVLVHVDNLTRRFEEESDASMGRIIAAQEVQIDMKVILDEFDHGIIMPDDGDPRDIRNRMRVLLRELAAKRGNQ